MKFSFSCSQTEISDELNTKIIDAKADAKKNGQRLTNQDILLKALNSYFGVKEKQIETNVEEFPIIEIKPESQIIQPIESNIGIPKIDMKTLGYYTNKETAKIVGCDESEVCSAHKEGLLKHRRNGHFIYQHIDDIKEWNKQKLAKKFA